MGALEVARPLWLALLGLPVLLLLLSARRGRARELALGTARFFASDDAEGERRRRRRPLASTLAALLALAALALALAGPGPRQGPASAVRLEVHVDRSPSIYLPVDGQAEGRTRLEAAVDRALELVKGSSVPAEIVWVDSTGTGPGDDGLRTGAFPAAWRRPPRTPRPEVDARLPDGGRVLLVTDRRPDPVPARAGWVASGGGPIPGAVALSEGGLLTWNGDDPSRPGSVEVREGEPLRLVAVGDVPPLLRELGDAWAASRGQRFERLEAVPGDPAPHLAVVAPDGAAAVDAATSERQLLGAGWRARGRVPADHGVEAPWVAAAPGRVELALVGAIEVPEAEVPALAAEWFRALDAALLEPEGVVALPERLDAGAPDVRLPAALAAGGEPSPSARRAAALRNLIGGALAAAAALLAAAAATLRARGR